MKLLSVIVIIIVVFIEPSTQQGACTQNPCLNGATCFAGSGDTYYCKCRSGFEGVNCEIANVCSGSDLRCLNGGTCKQNFTDPRGYSCSCPAMFEGEFCQTIKIDVCTAQQPCQNGGSCLVNSDVPQGYRCQCPVSYEGTNCETIISNGACSSQPCKNGGTCFRSFSVSSPGSALYICVCRPGYGGKDCEVPPPRAVDACESQPCLNGGTCFISSENDAKYICLCLEHFSGDHCEAVTIDVPDLCLVHNPCQNSSTCVHLTGASSVTCQCAPGFVGEHCDRVDTGDGECLPNPCLNGGSCNPDPFAADGYTCSCLAQFSGINCQREYIGCASDPCQNFGTCVVHAYGAYYCQCQEGYIGRLCEDRGPCADFPCHNGGTCLRQAQVYSQGRQYHCLCPDGFMGTHCEQLASEDPCNPNPCHSGTCYKSDIESGTPTVPFICLCPAYGTVGDFCDVDPCLSQPCVNGGSCNPIFNPVSRELVAIGCVCPTGYTGPTCAVVGPCQSNPCQNGGMCIDSSGSSPDPLTDWEVLPARLAFFCICPEQWAGTTCSEPSNPCASSPCFNGGTCNRVAGGFVCQCQGLYDGDRCQTMVDPCSPSPCMNAGRCEVFGGTYSCICAQPFIGVYCERSDPCASSPCLNNGTCFRSREDDQFICQCAEGFTGLTCQIIENHCLSQPCKNGGICFNGGGNLGYICVCGQLYEGIHCQDQIPVTTMAPPTTPAPPIPDACQPNPCHNLGRCVAVGSGIFAYTCLCPPDFAGLTCGVHLQPLAGACNPNPCLNGGTCVANGNRFTPSGDDGYLCLCGNGYTGNTCALFVESPDGSSSPGVHTTQRPLITQRTHVISGHVPSTPRSPDEQICFYDASVYEEGAVRVSDCVRCTCIDGEWLCGERNCDCMIDGVRYRNTDTWNVECNTCICNAGVEICTEMNCGMTCQHNGAYYINGVTRQDTCNTCVCVEGTWECTDVECGDTCLFGGETYLEGEMRKESCNSCFCLKEAQWLCTVRDCEGSPIIITVAFKLTAEFELIENNQQKFISVFKEDMRARYNLAKQNIQNVMVFPGSIEVMFDLVEIKDSNLNVQAVASDLEMKIQSRNYSLNYEGLDLFADPTSFRQERLETGPTKSVNSKILGLEQSTFIMIAVVACGAVGLLIVVASVCYFTRRAPRRAITEYGDTRLPTVSSREKPPEPEDGFVNSAYENTPHQDTQLPRSYRVTNAN